MSGRNAFTDGYEDSLKTIGFDKQHIDMFGRLRFAEPYEKFAVACDKSEQPDHYENITVNGGNTTYQKNKASVLMNVASGGDEVIRQSKYIRYIPSKSQQIFITGNFNGSIANGTKRMGYFDDENGLFFQVDSTGLSIGRRTSATGATANIITPQSEWTAEDKLDGFGDSGIELDITTQQVFVITFGWLGSAGVRFGVIINGVEHVLHEIFPSNDLTVPFMQTGSLPIRWELISVSGGANMTATCASVLSEGGANERGKRASVSTGATGNQINSGAIYPLISIRLKDEYKRARIRLKEYSALVNGSADYELLIFMNAGLSNYSWNSASEGVEFDISSNQPITSVGLTLHSDYGKGGQASSKSEQRHGILDTDIIIQSDYAGNPDIITIAIRALGDNNTFYGSIGWNEYY